MNIINRFHNWRRKQRWNKQYKNGRWENLKKPIEAERYRTIIKFIKAFGTKTPTILDLGCGEGVLNNYLESQLFKSFLGVDFSKVSIDKAQSKHYPKTNFIVADLHTFIPPNKVDVIILNEAFYYVQESEKRKVLDRILAKLNNNGILIVSIFREGHGCWEYFENLEKIDFTIVKTDEEMRYWKIGVFKKP
ncbi:class I SAM-dependent methyltransferase [Olleya aquimaris]|uniref:Methyltransferase family protein n=1 Tax=Olleya aquimaris TaxID=639310 RepID=A0A327R8N9_9FLAO|nr:class I SAM-dependent methyltransferase [Olleya aquimaris]RAJ13159.1 methyltransferase family protein [Olleya aquimaris]